MIDLLSTGRKNTVITTNHSEDIDFKTPSGVFFIGKILPAPDILFMIYSHLNINHTKQTQKYRIHMALLHNFHEIFNYI